MDESVCWKIRKEGTFEGLSSEIKCYAESYSAPLSTRLVEMRTARLSWSSTYAHVATAEGDYAIRISDFPNERNWYETAASGSKPV